MPLLVAADMCGPLPCHLLACDCSWDNATHDLIVAVGDEFVSTLGTRCAPCMPLACCGASSCGGRRGDHFCSCGGGCILGGAGGVLPRLPAAPCRLGVLHPNSPAWVAATTLVGRRYVVRDLLGQGTFGQVFKCVCADDADGEESGAIAIKVGPAAGLRRRGAQRCCLCATWSWAIWEPCYCC